MIVLRVIGKFFARIGRWIRDTAWVQPLLIVGGIFGIIFSIPHITSWVQSWFKEGNASESFYDNYSLSFSGIADGDSEVDEIFQYMEAMEDQHNSANSEIINKGMKKFGKKFFLSWYKDGCADCETNYKGYKTLKNNWNKNEFTFEGEKEDFKFFTIDVAATNSDGDFYFEKYVQKTAKYDNIFESAVDLWNPYVQYGHISSYDFLMEKDTVFTAPTTFLVDFTNAPNVDWDFQYGVTEIFCQIKGKDNKSDSYALARTLWDCWNHNGIFSSDPKEHQ